MKEILISDSELDELIRIMRLVSHDSEEIETLRKQWLKRFEQLKADRAYQEIGTLRYGYDEQIRGLPPMPAPRDAQE